MRRHRPSHVRQREWVIILPVEVVSGHGPLLAVAQTRGFTGLDTMVWRRSRSWWGGVLILTLGMMDILLELCRSTSGQYSFSPRPYLGTEMTEDYILIPVDLRVCLM